MSLLHDSFHSSILVDYSCRCTISLMSSHFHLCPRAKSSRTSLCFISLCNYLYIYIYYSFCYSIVEVKGWNFHIEFWMLLLGFFKDLRHFHYHLRTSFLNIYINLLIYLNHLKKNIPFHKI